MKCWQNSLWLNSKGLYLRFRKETENVCVMFTHSKKRAREIRKLRVADVKRQLTNDKSDARARCCCANINIAVIVAVAVVDA